MTVLGSGILPHCRYTRCLR